MSAEENWSALHEGPTVVSGYRKTLSVTIALVSFMGLRFLGGWVGGGGPPALHDCIRDRQRRRPMHSSSCGTMSWFVARWQLLTR